MNKDFNYYFEESMATSLVPKEVWPSNFYNTSAQMVAALTGLSTALGTIGANASIGELWAVATVGGGVGGSAGVGVVASGAAYGIAGITAAYYLGVCFGALLYAIQMITIGDSWMDSVVDWLYGEDPKINEVSIQLKKEGVTVPDKSIALLRHDRAKSMAR